MAKHRLVGGVMEIVSALVEDVGSRSVESMAEVNRLVVEKIARELNFVVLHLCGVYIDDLFSSENIISSNEYSTLLDWLMERSKSSRPSSKLFSLLILRSLIEQLSGISRAEVGLRVLRSIEVGILNQSSKASGFVDQGEVSVFSRTSL